MVRVKRRGFIFKRLFYGWTLINHMLHSSGNDYGNQGKKEEFMKRVLASTIGIFFIATLFSFSVMAETQSQKYLGKKESCIDISRIKQSRVLDDQTILFEMRGGKFYINRLPVRCVSLKIAGGFSYSTSIDKLCKQDIIKVVQPSSAPGQTCSIGEFVEFKEKGTIDKIEKLLEDGLLKDLVSEGAFETIK
jgi:hypothetical protein